MAHHKSALKRIRQTKTRRVYNRLNKKMLKEALKAVQTSLNYDEAIVKFNKASSVLDKIAARGILKKNTVAHRKSSLSRFVNSLKEQKN
ncbi:MAG: 30S ribosomal protein S20 [Ignavibacteria bacterium GWB2_35_12]|nr:MAG: 30S ribosomal protein S20 [Ignavibacteria bacterium GWA2_35_8]OGU40184.1 MAG: 30S ribosomal protein S20 [Ignavibacteria bacterium GWB2_35_12]OGU92378.1 MAG: 30S ribosomal protein S20 [Ignavibacteria bacterium RIFOXYA2_FULL_35_10]OGV22339.1 MAG: 30S ribosomal protein S20 [Ignavibacteria bacterium RIFOXYC2_FULL_35_21]